jgi:hypothetical protein
MRAGYWLRRIDALDPVRDHQEIYRISIAYEFPWDYVRALEFALFRTYCVPSISRLLAATGEFGRRPRKRYDDTALLMGEIAEWGYDHPRGRAAIGVVNRMHGRYMISDDDMRYVLSTFTFDPIEWIGKYGWRPLHEHERIAAFHYFRAVGNRMGIKEIPGTFEEFQRFKADYERDNFRFSQANNAIGTYTLNLFCSWYPKPLRPAVSLAVRGLLDPPMVVAFGFDPAPDWVGDAVRAGLRVRSAVVRVLPRRQTSSLLRPRSRYYPGYPTGYDPTDLGAQPPPADIDPTLLRRNVNPRQ